MRPGDKGPQVEELQKHLIALGYDPGKPDGDYGPKTKAAVLAFQLDYSDIDDDGIAGPQTEAKLASVADHAHDAPPTLHPATFVPCNAETWSAFEKLVALITSTPVRYGPGRGLWIGERFVITHGPGALGSKSMKTFLGHSSPSFHCTSLTNFFLAWLLRRNGLFTHAGNIPDLFTTKHQGLLELDATVHANPGGGSWRGYGDDVALLSPDGSGAKRSGVANVIDARELLARRASLPTFMVFGQSSKMVDGKYKWWHHTGLYIAHDGRLYRLAADGYRDATKGYSANPIKMAEITETNVHFLDAAIYRVYGVKTSDGSYGDRMKPIARVDIET